ncbi:MAG TPA: glycosyltransferase [Candidatus Limnocylindrales bacterium]|nr:glycosyltransferase [Candidatus Limnocylindrales bacterium]
MSRLRVAHVVRRFGGLTEPFILERVVGDRDQAELWTERLDQTVPGLAVRTVHVPWIAPGSIGERAFHRFPAIGPFLAGQYEAVERASSPDVIHAHYLTTGWLVGRRTTSPLVVSTYGFDATAMPRRSGWRTAFRGLQQRAAVIVAEGPFMRQTLIDLGFDGDRVRVVPIAAGFERLTYRDPQPPEGALRVMSCGRLVEKKGHDGAIRAFAAAGLPGGSRLDIVGDGPMRAQLMRLATRLGLEGDVRFVGSLDRRSYLDHLATIDLLIASSRTARNGDSEGGAPTTILDAQSIGVPVIGSDHCDIPFLIEDGVTGYLAAEGDDSALSDAIRRASDDRDQWPLVTRAGRAQVDRRHSGESVAALVESIHHEAARG